MTEAYSFDTGDVGMRSRVGFTTPRVLPKQPVTSRFSDPVDKQTFRISQENRHRKGHEVRTRDTGGLVRDGISSHTNGSQPQMIEPVRLPLSNDLVPSKALGPTPTNLLSLHVQEITPRTTVHEHSWLSLVPFNLGVLAISSERL